jgi:hypothetical protein
MHAGSAVFKTQSEAVVLLPGKQHEWKEAQEVRNGSKTVLTWTSEIPRKADIFSAQLPSLKIANVATGAGRPASLGFAK